MRHEMTSAPANRHAKNAPPQPTVKKEDEAAVNPERGGLQRWRNEGKQNKNAWCDPIPRQRTKERGWPCKTLRVVIETTIRRESKSARRSVDAVETGSRD